MKKALIIVAMASGCLFQPLSQAQTTNAPADKPLVEIVQTNWFTKLVAQVGEYTEVGGTFTARSSDFATAPSFSALVKLDVLKWQPHDRITVDGGVAYTFVPNWDTHLVGIGCSIALWSLPKKIEEVREGIPVVSAVTPKMLKVKAFIAIETQADDPGKEVFGTVGISFPFGG